MADSDGWPTPLARRLAQLIGVSGPVSIGEYMQLCLTDPRHGYYYRREAIGLSGDFVTSPQVSPLFGEMIGVWCVAAWKALGSPAQLVLAEAGPGLGTLMSDLLRATRPFAGFHPALSIRLIETSPSMRSRQAELLAGWRGKIAWCDTLAQLPDGPLLLVANEFLDALPFRQYAKHGAVWQERGVGIDAARRLGFALRASLVDATLLPPGHEREPEGSIFEIAPAREAFVADAANRLKRDGGFALWIDYGHRQSGFGDTFQSVRKHRFADPLAEPGMADLTSHVDFAALARAATMPEIAVSPIVTQADLLFGLRLAERFEMLAQKATPAQRQTLLAGIERLTGDDGMGKLFKAFAICAGAAADLPPPFNALPSRDAPAVDTA